jgi:hypothetical protein
MRATAKWIGPGVAQGVDDGRPVVERAMSRLVAPSDAIPEGQGRLALPGRSGGGDIVVHVAQIIVQGNGKGGIDRPSAIQQLTEIAEDVRRQLAMRTA